MADRPMLMSAPMVRAILAGTKTQTRRVMKNPPTWNTEHQPNGWQWNGRKHGEPALSKWPEAREIGKKLSEVAVCPYGKSGDRLWVREAWRVIDLANCFAPREITAAHRIWYEADGPHEPPAGRYRPGMFMPRWASRITLEITAVRVERLQDISKADAIAEGIQSLDGSDGPNYWTVSVDNVHLSAPTAQSCYEMLWGWINGPESWDANPWVWVVEFKRVTP